MAQHRRRNGAAEGSDGMGPAELHAETSLEIVGQEIVPLAATPGEFLNAAGAISQTPPERTELVLAASQSSLTRPMASDAGRSQRNGMEGQLVVANPVLNIGIATPESLQSAPTGQPVSFGPSANPLAIQDAETGVPNGPQVENLLPLFDDQQLRRLLRSINRLQWFFILRVVWLGLACWRGKEEKLR